MHGLGTFGARTRHGQTRTHKTHHGPDLGEVTTFPLIVYYLIIFTNYCNKNHMNNGINYYDQNYV
jgi:hypothetical protein